MAFTNVDWTLLYKVNHAVLLVTFLALATLHAYWAFGGNFGHGSAVPTVQGQPTFTPSFWGTMAVAMAFFLVDVALLTLASSVLWIRLLSLAAMTFTSLTFALRSIGDFKWVGFFKTQAATLSRCSRIDGSDAISTIRMAVTLFVIP